MQIIYVEHAIKNHPRTQRILARFGQETHIIECVNYREVFNPKAQNFRLQKQKPALILAYKPGNRVLPTPEGFGIGGQQNYYFSHMLNCIYDCRYCFLQGLYQSANYVVFVNYEDFMQEIADCVQAAKENIYFFSGYDGDSLAYEPVTGFLQDFLPFFAKYPMGILELRTKSANVKALLQHRALPNVIAAFSFTPQEISTSVEHKVPSVVKRIKAMQELAAEGWSLGLRFDPLIYAADFIRYYHNLIDHIFQVVPPTAIHSVSVGSLRFPVKMYHKLVHLYPDEKLLAHPLERVKNNFAYHSDLESEMKQIVLKHLGRYLPKTILFECQSK